MAIRLRKIFKPTQKEVVKNDRALRALCGMLVAIEAGEKPSEFIRRRYY